jgi:hypothetical protein
MFAYDLRDKEPKQIEKRMHYLMEIIININVILDLKVLKQF